MSVNPHRQTQSIASVIWNHGRVNDCLGWVYTKTQQISILSRTENNHLVYKSILATNKVIAKWIYSVLNRVNGICLQTFLNLIAFTKIMATIKVQYTRTRYFSISYGNECENNRDTEPKRNPNATKQGRPSTTSIALVTTIHKWWRNQQFWLNTFPCNSQQQILSVPEPSLDLYTCRVTVNLGHNLTNQICTSRYLYV